jgi:hypothetical protein
MLGKELISVVAITSRLEIIRSFSPSMSMK